MKPLNRLCASGMSAAAHACRPSEANEGELLWRGVEHMTRGPWVMSKTSTPYGRDTCSCTILFGWRCASKHGNHGTDAMGPPPKTCWKPGAFPGKPKTNSPFNLAKSPFAGSRPFEREACTGFYSSGDPLWLAATGLLNPTQP